MSKTINAAMAVLCIIIIACCAILIVQKLVGRARMDLTEHEIYTLSEGTQHILAKLNQPVKLKLYYSRLAAMKGPEEIRFYNNYYLYVRDLLEEYVKHSGGNLNLEVIDPRRFSDEEENAIKYGLKRFPFGESEVFFFGLVAHTEFGKEKAIDFFEPDRQEFVEYDISKLITGVIRRDKKTIGVISFFDVTGGDMSPFLSRVMRMQGREPPEPWTLVQHLRDTYKIRTIGNKESVIPKDIDFLMVIYPKHLPKTMLFAIDQFVMKGGKLLVFVDPYCLKDRPSQDPDQYVPPDYDKSADLNDLLRRWGVEMNPKPIVVDRMLATKAKLALDQNPTDLLPYLTLKQGCFNASEVISSSLHNASMLFAGALTRTERSGITVTPLLTTTSTGTTWEPASVAEIDNLNPDAIRQAVTDGTEPIMLACRISGKLTTNFPDGYEVEEEKPAGETDNNQNDESVKTHKLEAVLEASPEASVVVVADVDMISDILAYRTMFFGQTQANDNASLVLNSLDFLDGSDDLIAIRSRGGLHRPFIVVDRIEKEAEAATADEVSAVNEKIKKYQEELQSLGASTNENNRTLIQSAAIAKRKTVEEDIRKAEKELRRLNAVKRARIEKLGSVLQTHNMVLAPATVLLIAITLAAIRHVRAKRYAARRTQ